MFHPKWREKGNQRKEHKIKKEATEAVKPVQKVNILFRVTSCYLPLNYCCLTKTINNGSRAISSISFCCLFILRIYFGKGVWDVVEVQKANVCVLPVVGVPQQQRLAARAVVRRCVTAINGRRYGILLLTWNTHTQSETENHYLGYVKTHLQSCSLRNLNLNPAHLRIFVLFFLRIMNQRRYWHPEIVLK